MIFRRKGNPELESKKALYLAKKHLQEVQARGPEVREVVEKTVSFREANHFAEQLTALMRGGKPA